MRRKRHRVFVSYHFQTEEGWGIANNTSFYTHRKYISISEIRDIERELRKAFNYKAVVIMNYRFV